MEQNDVFEKMQNNVSEKDVKKIDAKLGGMNRGPISKIWDRVKALWAFIKDPQAPKAGKILAIAALIYLISPIDAIPDFIPGLGLTDDVGVVLAVVAKLGADLKKYMNQQ